MAHIEAVPSDEASFAESALFSNFNGLAYAEIGDKWPVNKANKRPLDFVMQIVNNGKLPLAPQIKLVQFFFDWHQPAYSDRQSGWYIRTYHHVHPKRMAVTARAYNPAFCTIKFRHGKSLPDWESIDHYHGGFSDACFRLDNQHPWEVYSQMRNELIGNSEIGSQLGGYPQWIQCFATPRYDNRWAYFIAQIDTDDHARLRFGDMGSVYLFQHPQFSQEYGYVFQTL
jgi:uncharacterized protein YwqG